MLHQDFHPEYWDFWDLSRFLIFVEIFWDLSRYLTIIEAFWGTSGSKNMMKLTNSWSRQTVEICQKCHVSTDFLISIETFETGRWCQDKIEISQSRLRLLNCWDKLFEIVKIFLIVETYSLLVSRSRVSIETTLRQIKTPRLNNPFRLWNW